MISKIFRILILVLLPSVTWGQSLRLSVTNQTSDNNPSTFLLDQGEVTIRSGNVQFLRSSNKVSNYEALGISHDRSIVGVLDRSTTESRLVVLSSVGDTLTSYSGITISANDPSLAVYPMNNGQVLLRDNITNFTFYDTFGEIITNMSSSSQSKEGEAISEVAMSPDGQTIVIYNPKIKRNGNLGSKIQVRRKKNTFKNIYFSDDRYLKNVSVSDDGNLIVAISANSGTEDRVLIMDKFGNELNTISTDENLKGAALSSDSEYMVLYSKGRVMVYETRSGERLGAASFRSPVFMASYFPGSNLMLAMTGNYSKRTGILNNVKFRAVDLEQRKITSKEFSSALGFTNAIAPRLVRLSANTYQLVGASKHVTIEANF